jgi:hypothetical protein
LGCKCSSPSAGDHHEPFSLLACRWIAVVTSAGNADQDVAGSFCVEVFDILANAVLMPIGFTSPTRYRLLKNYSIVAVFVGARAEKFPERGGYMNDTMIKMASRRQGSPSLRPCPPLEEAGYGMRAAGDRTIQGRIGLKIS